MAGFFIYAQFVNPLYACIELEKGCKIHSVNCMVILNMYLFLLYFILFVKNFLIICAMLILPRLIGANGR